MWIRRSPLIMCEWRGPETFVRHIGTGLVCRVGTEALAFLDTLGKWQERNAHSNDTAIEEMLKIGLLEASHTRMCPEERVDANYDTWAPLGWSARLYHSQTLNAEYLTGGNERDEMARQVALHSKPFTAKRYERADYAPLPAGEPIEGMTLRQTLEERRTTRHFTPEPVTWPQLSTLLYYAFGIQGYVQAGPFGRVPVKASPAAGARHEAEAYVISLGSEAIEPGVFHYQAAEHSVAQVASLPAGGIGDLVYHQQACTGAPAVIFATAVLSRLSEKYRHPRAYRLWMYDIGHVGQTLALTATALGLGVFQTIAFRDSALAELINCDLQEEFPSYLFSVGHPDTAHDSS